jgi:hypothetical protein
MQPNQAAYPRLASIIEQRRIERRKAPCREALGIIGPRELATAAGGIQNIRAEPLWSSWSQYAQA